MTELNAPVYEILLPKVTIIYCNCAVRMEITPPATQFEFNFNEAGHNTSSE